MRRITRSKTMCMSIAIAVLGVVQASLDVFTPYVSAQGVGLIGLIVGVIMAVLRIVTTQPLKDK